MLLLIALSMMVRRMIAEKALIETRQVMSGRPSSMSFRSKFELTKVVKTTSFCYLGKENVLRTTVLFIL